MGSYHDMGQVRGQLRWTFSRLERKPTVHYSSQYQTTTPLGHRYISASMASHTVVRSPLNSAGQSVCGETHHDLDSPLQANTDMVLRSNRGSQIPLCLCRITHSLHSRYTWPWQPYQLSMLAKNDVTPGAHPLATIVSSKVQGVYAHLACVGRPMEFSTGAECAGAESAVQHAI